MMNFDKHRYTRNQVRLILRRAHWTPSGRTGDAFKDHEILRRHPSPRQIHPKYRRRRLKHPAYYSIRYVRGRYNKSPKRAPERYSEPITMRGGGYSRMRRHPDPGLRLIWFTGVLPLPSDP